MVENPFTSFKTTEIHVTSEPAGLPTSSNTNVSDKLDPKCRVMSSRGYEQYSIKIERGPISQGPPPTPGTQAAVQRLNRTAMEANTAAWGYTKCALMFFVSLMITWVGLLPVCTRPYLRDSFFPSSLAFRSLIQYSKIQANNPIQHRCPPPPSASTPSSTPAAPGGRSPTPPASSYPSWASGTRSYMLRRHGARSGVSIPVCRRRVSAPTYHYWGSRGGISELSGREGRGR